ncbi:MAG: hypothetical protein EAZ55_09545 [Cytophagales bacterium]|nr:MAG: hypothetical protein EAZ55_09545 [Cytophagales bacterium]
MKNTTFLSIFVLLFLLVSCKKTEENPAPTTPQGTPLAFLLKNTGQAYGKGLSVDKNDNFYYTSLFQGTLEGKSISSVGGIDNYFAKHDKNGNLIWERSFGGTGSTTVAHGIDTDDAGNVYLAGYFGVDGQNASRTINFGNGKTAVSKSDFDVFVAKYDALGTAQWVFALGNSAGSTEERAWDIVVEANGNFYISGAFSGTVDFNPLGTARNLSTTGIGHFLAKYNSSGENIWAIKFDANITNLFTEGYTTVDFDQNGNVFLAGVYRNSLTIGTTNLTSAGNSDFFLASFNASNGNANWAKSFGGAGNDIVSPGAMRVNKNGEPHITGRFSGSSNFGGTNLTSNSAGNVFVLACTNAGSTKWAIVCQSSEGLDGGHRVDFDAQNNVYVAGWFRGTTNFNGKGTANITSNGTSDAGDVFLAKYNSNGDYVWAKNIGGVVSGADNLAICAGLGVDSQGNSIITGKVYGTNIDFDTHATETFMLSSSGQDDCFVAKYTTNGEIFKNWEEK